MSVADPAEILQELRRLCDRLPMPQESWHPYVPSIRACRADLAQAIDLAAARPEAVELAGALLAGDVELAFDRTSSPELTAAFDRLDAVPTPSGRHPYLDEILPAFEGLRLILVALSHASGS